MQVRYHSVVGGTPKVIPLDNNVEYFQVAIRAGAATVEYCLEDPQDFTAPNTYTQAPSQLQAPGITVTWVAAPAAVAGITTLTTPAAAVRISNATDIAVTVLQQGLR